MSNQPDPNDVYDARRCRCCGCPIEDHPRDAPCYQSALRAAGRVPGGTATIATPLVANALSLVVAAPRPNGQPAAPTGTVETVQAGTRIVAGGESGGMPVHPLPTVGDILVELRAELSRVTVERDRYLRDLAEIVNISSDNAMTCDCCCMIEKVARRAPEGPT